MNRPTYAVVVPLYNHEAYIEACIESVLNQTLPVSEIVIVDDGSKDSSFKLAQQYVSKNPTISLYKQENLGTAKTLNWAISMCKSQWIAVLNSDDIFANEKISRCFEISHEQPGIEIISGMLRFVDSSNLLITEGLSVDWMRRGLDFYNRSESLPLSIINENFIATTSNMVFRKELWKKVGGFQDYRYCNDMDFLLRSFQHKSYFFDETFYHIDYRLHGMNTISEEIAAIRLERAFVSMKNLSRLPQEDLKSKYFIEAIRNLKLGEQIYILNMLTNTELGDLSDWENAKKLLLNENFSKSLDF
jgi:glycosyltransferase involved in cell wall biosynthesis